MRELGRQHFKPLIRTALISMWIALGLALSASYSFAYTSKTVEARRLLEARDVTGAISAMQGAVGQETDAHGADSPEVAVALGRLGLLAMARKAPDFDGAKKAYERALRIREMRFGLRDPRVALVLEDLARMHLAEATDSSDTEAHEATARRLLERALRIRAKRGVNHPEVADALYNLATGLRDEQGSGTKIIGLHRNALSIRERAFGPSSLLVAESLVLLAHQLVREQGMKPNPSGNRQEALAWCRRAEPAFLLLERALAIQEKEWGTDAVELTKVLRDLAQTACSKAGERTDPITLYKRILAIDEKTSGQNSTSVRDDLIQLSVRLSSPGQAAEKRAVELRENAIREAHLGDDPRKVWESAAADLSSKLITKFDAEEKLDRVEKVDDFLLVEASRYELPSRPYGNEHSRVARTYETLGDLASAERVLRAYGTNMEKADFLAAHGRLTEAAPEYKSALERFESRRASNPVKISASDRRGHYVAVDNYVALLMKQNAGKQAEHLLVDALDLEQHAAESIAGFTIERLDALADFYFWQGKAQEAENDYRKALDLAEIERQRPHAGKVFVLRQYDKLIALYVAGGRFQDADVLFKRSLSVEQPDYENIKIMEASPTVSPGGPERPSVCDRLEQYATFKRSRGDAREADALHRRALAVWAVSLEQDVKNAATVLDPGSTRDWYNLKRWEILVPIYRELGDVQHEQATAKLASAALKRSNRPR